MRFYKTDNPAKYMIENNKGEIFGIVEGDTYGGQGTELMPNMHTTFLGYYNREIKTFFYFEGGNGYDFPKELVKELLINDVTILSYMDSIKEKFKSLSYKVLEWYKMAYYPSLGYISMTNRKKANNYAHNDLQTYKKKLIKEGKGNISSYFHLDKYYKSRFVLENYGENEDELVEKICKEIRLDMDILNDVEVELARYYHVSENYNNNPLSDSFLAMAQAVNSFLEHNEKVKNLKLTYNTNALLQEYRKQIEEDECFTLKDSIENYLTDNNTLTVMVGRYEFGCTEDNFVKWSNIEKVIGDKYISFKDENLVNYLPALEKITYGNKVIYQK